MSFFFVLLRRNLWAHDNLKNKTKYKTMKKSILFLATAALSLGVWAQYVGSK